MQSIPSIDCKAFKMNMVYDYLVMKEVLCYLFRHNEQ